MLEKEALRRLQGWENTLKCIFKNWIWKCEFNSIGSACGRHLWTGGELPTKHATSSFSKRTNYFLFQHASGAHITRQPWALWAANPSSQIWHLKLASHVKNLWASDWRKVSTAWDERTGRLVQTRADVSQHPDVPVTYHSTQRRIPQDADLSSHRRENLHLIYWPI